MPEFLLEILSEEIPARMQARAADNLKRLVTDKLKEVRLEFTDARAYATPRRLALVVDGLPERQPDITEERKGPRVGAPEKAIEGFLKSAGLDSVDQCEVRDTGKGEFYFTVSSKAGKDTQTVLGDILFDVLWRVPWPKSMTWAEADFRWVRPVHGVVAVLGDKIIPLSFSLVVRQEGDGERIRAGDKSDATIEFGNRTVGHRFLAPDPFEVTDFSDYEKKLRAAFVILDAAERKRIIAEQASALAKAAGLTVKDDPGLLDETAGLVEWPCVLMGTIDDAFMDLPDEVLSTSMRSHQKYFSCLDADGRLASRFLVVANMAAEPGTTRHANIVAGNERVLRARLSDAKFFWDLDRMRPLRSRAPALKDIVFHAKLGSLDEKVDRVEALAVEIAGRVPGAARDQVASAARLAKADLTTGMVGEFPELQGVMGRYYALADGEDDAVADAIAEHYSPLGPADACPTRPVSVAVALADKIDTLVGFWAIDEKPTGSRDPYALRRAALGVIRLVLENGLRLPLTQTMRIAFLPIGEHLELISNEGFDYILYLSEKHLTDVQKEDENIEANWDRVYRYEAIEEESASVADSLLEFFADRLKVHLREQGVRHDLVAAVFELGGEDDLVRLLARVDALKSFLDTDDGANLLVAYRRAVNIVAIEEKKDETSHDGAVDEGTLAEPAEKALADSLARVARDATAALDAEDFTGAMAALAKLRTPVDLFFDKVTVNVDEPALRANRLRLLSRIRATLNRVADFSKIEG